MGINEILLIAAALLPAIILLIYVYVKDRVEKEPPLLLGGLFLAGVIIIIPVIIVEIILEGIIDLSFGVTAENLEAFSSNVTTFKIYTAVSMFIGVALVEEFFKWISMLILTRKSKNFNSLFDGLVYAIFVSLGFAALENVFYVIQNGWVNAIMRAVLSVPGHMFFAVMMGYFYSLWHMNDKAKALENEFKQIGVIAPSSSAFDSGLYKVLSLVVPIMLHGFYNYCCSAGGIIEIIAMLVLIVALYIFCFKKIKELSKEDTSDTVYALRMIHKKYPSVVQWANENPELYNSIIDKHR